MGWTGWRPKLADPTLLSAAEQRMALVGYATALFLGPAAAAVTAIVARARGLRGALRHCLFVAGVQVAALLLAGGVTTLPTGASTLPALLLVLGRSAAIAVACAAWVGVPLAAVVVFGAAIRRAGTPPRAGMGSAASTSPH